MRLSIIFFTSLLVATFSLSCEEDIRCCRILQVEELNKRLDKEPNWFDFWNAVKNVIRLIWSEKVSHHFLRLTIDDEENSIVFMELGGESEANKKTAQCYMGREELPEEHRLSKDATFVDNGMTVGRLYKYCIDFYSDKKYSAIAHFPGSKEVYGVMGVKCANCITVTQYLWGKLTDKYLKDTEDKMCEDDE